MEEGRSRLTPHVCNVDDGLSLNQCSSFSAGVLFWGLSCKKLCFKCSKVFYISSGFLRFTHCWNVENDLKCRNLIGETSGGEQALFKLQMGTRRPKRRIFTVAVQFRVHPIPFKEVSLFPFSLPTFLLLVSVLIAVISYWTKTFLS